MASSPGVTKQGFFGNPAVPTSVAAKSHKAALMDMGGNGDCFRALAAGIVDNFLSANRIKNDFYNQLMVRHLAYFPQHRPTAVGLMTPSERMSQIIKRVNTAELINALAYTLRQIAVDEVIANPAEYRAMFTGQAQMTPDVMRNPANLLDKVALAAVSKALSMSIDVRVSTQGKELALRVKYNPTATNSKVTLQWHDDYCIPFIANQTAFTTVKSKPIRVVEPASAQDSQQDYSELHSVIDQDDARILAEFQNVKHRLEVMVSAGEINEDDLINIYITSLHHKAEAGKYHVGTEHGTSALFAVIERAKNGVNTGAMLVEAHQQDTAEGLVKAIARNVSFGLMSSAEVFEQIDNKESHSSRAPSSSLTAS